MRLAPTLYAPRSHDRQAGRLVPLSATDTIGAARGLVERRRLERLGAWLRNPALLCLVAALVCSGAILLVLAGDVIFLRDEWAVVLYRRGFSAGAFLDPHAGHLSAAVIA